MEEDWQNSVSSPKDRNMHLLQTGLRADCYFLVGIEAESQESIKAHKYMICAASPVFERMFYGNIPEKGDQPIVIDDIEAEDFKNMLFFIYTFEIDVKSAESAQRLYCVADKYIINPLKKMCIKYLCSKLNVADVLELFVFSKRFDERGLEEKCLELLRNETDKVLQSKKFLFAHPSALDAIVSQDKLNITNELELFNALDSYALVQVQIGSEKVKDLAEYVEINTNDERNNSNEENEEKPKSSKSKVDDEHKEDILSDLKKIVKKIRFLCMTCQEFAAGPIYSQLLDRNDALEILACIAHHPNESEHFPPGFSTSRVNRCRDVRCHHGYMAAHRLNAQCTGGIPFNGIMKKIELHSE